MTTRTTTRKPATPPTPPITGLRAHDLVDGTVYAITFQARLRLPGSRASLSGGLESREIPVEIYSERPNPVINRPGKTTAAVTLPCGRRITAQHTAGTLQPSTAYRTYRKVLMPDLLRQAKRPLTV